MSIEANERMLTVDTLLNDPVRFDRQVVEVVGFCSHVREHNALYPSPAHLSKGEGGIWLTQPAAATPRDVHRTWVVVKGTFYNRRSAGAGHMGLYSAEIRNITSIERCPEGAEPVVS